MLEIELQGTMHTVSRPLPIARHIAENYGLAGRNEIESAYAYLVVSHCLDFIKEGRSMGGHNPQNLSSINEIHKMN